MQNFPSRHEQHEGNIIACYMAAFSAAKRYQRSIACCYENYLTFFLCGFLGGNENFAEIIEQAHFLVLALRRSISFHFEMKHFNFNTAEKICKK